MLIRERTTGTYRGEAGFSLIELLIVVAIIVIMVAVALPNIGGFLRTYKIKGATQQVAGEIQAARTKAVMRNANIGVTFAIVDSNSYRYFREDEVGPDILNAPLRDLPFGLQFQPGPDPGIRFNRLGSWCRPMSGSSACPVFDPAASCLPSDGTRCNDTPSNWTTVNYMTVNPATGVATITLVESVSGITRWVSVAPGGRVMTQP